MKITYLNHSSFFLELENKNLLLDYGKSPARPKHGLLAEGVFDSAAHLGKTPNLIGYSSHRHGDHFDSKLIKDFVETQTPYILSDEPDFPPESYMKADCFYRLLPQTMHELEGLKIANTGSTDQGGSILFEEDGADFSIYFGADLAVWDDFPEFYAGFEQEFKWLASKKDQFHPVKVIFLPSGTGDGYQEDPLLDGSMRWIKLFQPQVVIPMHGAPYPEYYPGFAEAMLRRADGMSLKVSTFGNFQSSMLQGTDTLILYPENTGESILLQ